MVLDGFRPAGARNMSHEVVAIYREPVQFDFDSVKLVDGAFLERITAKG